MNTEENALKKQVSGTHYKSLAIQPVEYCQKNKLGFCESSVIKYVTRHREKNGAEDIRKAIHFLELLLQIEYGETDAAKIAEQKENAWQTEQILQQSRKAI